MRKDQGLFWTKRCFFSHISFSNLASFHYFIMFTTYFPSLPGFTYVASKHCPAHSRCFCKLLKISFYTTYPRALKQIYKSHLKNRIIFGKCAFLNVVTNMKPLLHSYVPKVIAAGNTSNQENPNRIGRRLTIKTLTS
jgi:hypothetical protein